MGLVAGAGGVLALGVGSLFGLKAQSLDNQARAMDHCDNATGCDETGAPLNRDARANGNLATTFFVAGGALLAGGVTLYLLGAPRAPGSTLRTEAIVTANTASLSIRGGF